MHPLALDAEQPIAQREDEVVATTFGDGPVYVDAQFDRGLGNRELRDGALLVGRELHAVDRSHGLGGAVSVLDGGF